MRPKLLVLYAFFVLFWAQCKAEKPDSVYIDTGRTVTFQLPGVPKAYNSGWLPFPERGGLFFFAQNKTLKFLVFCDSAGRLVKQIDLETVSRKLSTYDGISVYDTNLIAAYSMTASGLYTFDGSGQQKSYAHLPVYFGETAYRVQATFINQTTDNRDLFIDVTPRSEPYSGPDGKIKDYAGFAKAGRDGPVVVRIKNPLGASPVLAPLMEGIENRWNRGIDFYGSTLHRYVVSGQYVFYVSPYIDTLYRISLKNGAVLPVAIKSAFTKIGLGIPENKQARSDILKYDYHAKGVVTNIVHDPYKKRVYLCVYHETEMDSNAMPGRKETRAWSLIVYNESLERLAEKAFPPAVYLPRTAFCSPEGIWVRKEDDDETVHIYQLIRVHDL